MTRYEVAVWKPIKPDLCSTFIILTFGIIHVAVLHCQILAGLFTESISLSVILDYAVYISAPMILFHLGAKNIHFWYSVGSIYWIIIYLVNILISFCNPDINLIYKIIKFCAETYTGTLLAVIIEQDYEQQTNDEIIRDILKSQEKD
jgi:hypothetical protein